MNIESWMTLLIEESPKTKSSCGRKVQSPKFVDRVEAPKKIKVTKTVSKFNLGKFN